jgi:hypothetical protein
VPRAPPQEKKIKQASASIRRKKKKTDAKKKGGAARLLPGTAQDILGTAARRKGSTPGERKKNGARLENRSHPPYPVESPDKLAFGPSVF